MGGCGVGQKSQGCPSSALRGHLLYNPATCPPAWYQYGATQTLLDTGVKDKNTRRTYAFCELLCEMCFRSPSASPKLQFHSTPSSPTCTEKRETRVCERTSAWIDPQTSTHSHTFEPLCMLTPAPGHGTPCLLLCLVKLCSKASCTPCPLRCHLF